MDRREALKKLGVGTAVVAASPAVLPSFRVAHAASGGIGETGLIGVPPSDTAIPFNRIYDNANSWREVRLQFDNSAVNCVDGGTPDFSVQWRIAQAELTPWNGTKRLRITTVKSGPIDWGAPDVQNWPAGSEITTMPSVPSTYSGGGYGSTAHVSTYLVRIRFDWGEQIQLDGYIDNAITYRLEARCRWHCPGASTDVVAEYGFAGAGRNLTLDQFISWDDRAPA